MGSNSWASASVSSPADAEIDTGGEKNPPASNVIVLWSGTPATDVESLLDNKLEAVSTVMYGLKSPVTTTVLFDLLPLSAFQLNHNMHQCFHLSLI